MYGLKKKNISCFLQSTLFYSNVLDDHTTFALSCKLLTGLLLMLYMIKYPVLGVGLLASSYYQYSY